MEGDNEGATQPTSSFDEVSWTNGIGAVKYADLSMNLSYGRMLSLSTNMLYAYARICRIR